MSFTSLTNRKPLKNKNKKNSIATTTPVATSNNSDNIQNHVCTFARHFVFYLYAECRRTLPFRKWKVEWQKYCWKLAASKVAKNEEFCQFFSWPMLNMCDRDIEPSTHTISAHRHDAVLSVVKWWNVEFICLSNTFHIWSFIFICVMYWGIQKTIPNELTVPQCHSLWPSVESHSLFLRKKTI